MPITPFRLFDLPFLAKRLMFEYFEAIEIFEFSFTSPRVRNVELPLMKLRAIEHNIRFDGIPIIETIIRKDSILGDTVMEIHFCDSRCNDPDENDERLIRCHHLKIRKKFSKFKVCHHNSEFAVSVVFDHLFCIFPAPINTISLNLSIMSNLTAVLLNPHFEKCEKLEICDDYEYAAEESDLEQVLDLVSVSKAMEVFISLPSGLEMDKIGNLESLILRDAKWMSLKFLCSIKCENISLAQHQFDSDCFQAYVQWWFNSYNYTLRTLHLGWNNSDSELELDTEKLPWEPWNPKKRSRYFYIPNRRYYLSNVDCAGGVDITRSDGLTATCLIHNVVERSLMFLVWHDPFPEKLRIIELTHLISKGIKQFNSIYNAFSKDERHGVLGKAVLEVIQNNAKDATSYAFLESSLAMSGDDICLLYLQILQQLSKLKREFKIWANS